jgi:ectoine hydroxylase-related dioxygenase (phytanoyl-CoA dioxygenase family)
MTCTAPVNEFEDALEQCGVTEMTLAPREKEALDRQGYLVLADVLDDDRLARLRAAFEAALAQGKRHGVHVQMDWHDAVFDGLYTHPKVLAAAYHVLRRPFKSTGVVGRDPAPGQGQQALHTDWPRAPAEPFQIVTALWLLDDYTPDNGATRVVPGSHKMPYPLPKRMAQPESRHPEEKFVIATAGSVLIFNSHLLHSGTRNRSGKRRRVLQCPYAARDVVHLMGDPPELPERLPAAVRYLLGGQP